MTTTPRTRALAAGAAITALSALVSVACSARAAAPPPDLSVKEIGSLHVGGRSVTLSGLPVRDGVTAQGVRPERIDPNGDFEVEQMYAQYVKLTKPRAKYPLLLAHGGGLTGVTYETKPDGGEGWQMFFLRAGYDVYVSDAVERGRASWARFPEIFPSEPTTTTKKIAWETFRIGPLESYATDPAKRRALPGTQFPTAAFDQFAKQFVPRWSTTNRQIQAGYDALVQKICPCIVLVHSQGGNFGFTAALHAPDKIKALVAVEPVGTPAPDAITPGLRSVPQLVVWGDNVALYPRWVEIKQRVERYEDALRRGGGHVEQIVLPEMGVKGNSHMMMMDRNSDAVAGIIERWMERQGLLR